MFVCQECIRKNGCWHPTASVGNCEICGNYRECGDCCHKHPGQQSLAKRASEVIQREGFIAFLDELAPGTSETEPIEGAPYMFQIVFKDGSKLTFTISSFFVEN